MIECALVFARDGSGLKWHLPPGTTGVHIPDHAPLADFLWERREVVGGIAHVHPWSGEASPSHEDLTTFSGIETMLGRRLVWPILTFSDEKHFYWTGPDRLDYKPGDFHPLDHSSKLRELARQGKQQ